MSSTGRSASAPSGPRLADQRPADTGDQPPALRTGEQAQFPADRRDGAETHHAPGRLRRVGCAFAAAPAGEHGTPDQAEEAPVHPPQGARDLRVVDVAERREDDPVVAELAEVAGFVVQQLPGPVRRAPGLTEHALPG